MRFVIVFLTFLFATAAQAIDVDTCPETLEINLTDFKQGEPPDVSENNPHIPYAYIQLASFQSKTLKYNLRSKARSQCEYDGLEKGSAQIVGSLKEGAKEPATLRIYLPSEYQEYLYSFVIYASIAKLTSDKALVLKDTANVYVTGEECNNGECMTDYFRMGTATAFAVNDVETSCLSLESAKEKLTEYLDTKTNYRDKTITRLVDSLKWKEGNGYSSDVHAFYTEVAERWTCAPSADCWFGYYVTCDGTVEHWSGGED